MEVTKTNQVHEGAHAQLMWAWRISVVAMEVGQQQPPADQRLPVSISAVHAVRNDDASSEGKHLHSLQNKSESICNGPAGCFWQLTGRPAETILGL